MKLHPHVYYRRYGEYTYLRHLQQKKNYLFNLIVFDILEIINTTPHCSLEKIYEELLELYNVTDIDSFHLEIKQFIDELTATDILLDETASLVQNNISGNIMNILYGECFREHQLFSVCLELTYRCNERCIHCYIDSPPKEQPELQLCDYEKIIDEIKDMGCLNLLITGGEPTLHPDFLQIVEYAKKVGLVVDIFTNGLKIPDELLFKLIDLKPNSISFSFYGGTAAVHDAVTCVPGSFEKSLRTMMICKCADIDTYIKSVVMQNNYHDYENLLRLGKRLNINVTSSLVISPTHSGELLKEYRLLDVSKYQKIIELDNMYNSSTENDDIPYRDDHICASGLSMLSINPYGEIYPCNANPTCLGNIKNNSIHEVWETSEYLKKLQNLHYNQISENCSSCVDRNWCSLCLGMAYRENGKLAPCLETCMLAQVKHTLFELKNHSQNIN